MMVACGASLATGTGGTTTGAGRAIRGAWRNSGGRSASSLPTVAEITAALASGFVVLQQRRQSAAKRHAAQRPLGIDFEDPQFAGRFFDELLDGAIGGFVMMHQIDQRLQAALPSQRSIRLNHSGV